MKRFDTKIEGGRLTTLPGQNGSTGAGPLGNKDGKVLNGNTGINGRIGNVGNGNTTGSTGINGRIGNTGNTGINGRINQVGTTNGQPLIKRLDTPRVTTMPAKQVEPADVEPDTGREAVPAQPAPVRQWRQRRLRRRQWWQWHAVPRHQADVVRRRQRHGRWRQRRFASGGGMGGGGMGFGRSFR